MAFYQQEPFYNPRVPFTGSIQGGLLEGKSIIISGRVLPGANRFHVNLQCGSRHGADVALHFNPRYDSGSGYIVTNTLRNSQWGSEERIHKAVLPAGGVFTLQIMVDRASYKISVNGMHVMEYNHRIQLSMVDTIVVDGMVEVNSIAFQNPVRTTLHRKYCLLLHKTTSNVSWLAAQSVPYKSVIAGGLQPGKNITINGVVNHQAHRFSFNLRHMGGVALHYNPRFDENTVVRNTLTGEKWGSEERFGGLPFNRGQPFQVVISCNPHHYNVFVNGNQAHTYNHRFTRLHEIDVLEISGDLTLTSVMV
uniref:Galectin n=1 Tax=Astyanax mexicanus TaxID=7994 RepID=A0A3B1IUK3_ASTMX